MPRIMIFIDGTWLYRNIPRLKVEYAESQYGINYGKLPTVIGQKIGETLLAKDVDVVRTWLFGSYPDPDTLVEENDKESARHQLRFFGFLKEEFHYEVEPFSIDFHGHRLSKKDRDAEYVEFGTYVERIKADPLFATEEHKKLETELGALMETDPSMKRALNNPRLHDKSKRRLLAKKWGFLKAYKHYSLHGLDDAEHWEPKEKCVDIALATNMLFFAAIPHAYDIAVAIIGDADYKPVLQSVRRLGKRILIASIEGSCPQEFFVQEDPQRLRDFDTIFLNDILADISLDQKKEKRQCAACRKEVWEAFYLRKGREYYCPECRQKHYSKLKPESKPVMERPIASEAEESAPAEEEILNQES